jgi:hypothetical protein
MQRAARDGDVLAIDPGGVHCGMAWYFEGQCMLVEEHEPADCVDLTAHWLRQTGGKALVIEEFRLYPWLAAQQSFSTFETVEVIGSLKTVHRWLGGGTALAMQPASIKEPTRKIMRARNQTVLASQSKAGIHCADAELHGYYYTHQQNR